MRRVCTGIHRYTMSKLRESAAPDGTAHGAARPVTHVDLVPKFGGVGRLHDLYKLLARHGPAHRALGFRI